LRQELPGERGDLEALRSRGPAPVRISRAREVRRLDLGQRVGDLVQAVCGRDGRAQSVAGGVCRENLPLSFELLSIDETSAQPALEEWSGKNLPGSIKWIRSEEDFGSFLDALSVERNASIPIHVLVDPKGMVRCVRVGAIHEQNYGSVRDLIAE
jgi:hypothetical protein